MTRPILTHTLVASAGAHPRSWLVVLHGFFGAGRNWTTVARGLAAARPDWGVVLADLRLHGGSQGFAPPHTLESCAADVAALVDAVQAPAPALLGHSFGGKVVLVYLTRRPRGLRQAWIVDADPSASPAQGGAWEMLRVVRALPQRFAARRDLVAALERAGYDRRTADWMATNLDRTEDGYRWRLDFDALEALLRDFFRTDLWAAIEHPPPGVDVRVVKATRSQVIAPASELRLQAIQHATGHVVTDSVEGGHWLNADNPDALSALLAAGLPGA